MSTPTTTREASTGLPLLAVEDARTPVTGGEALVRALAAHGAELAFGIPGTHNLEIYRHLPRHGIRHVNPRHEQGAGYAADAYARLTGRPGVAVTTTGPALLNIAAAAGQAYSDSVPLLVVSPGMPLRHPALPTGLLHEMRSQTRALDGVVAFSHRVSSVAEIGPAVARAFALFTGGRPRPAHLEIPLDLLEATGDPGPPCTAPPVVPASPAPEPVRAAARALAAAERPALVAGGGARGAAAGLRTLAERLGAPLVTTANGKGVLDETHPLALGVGLHSPAVQEWLAERDVVLAVGTELAEADTWVDRLPLRGTLLRADADPGQMYAGLPADVPLVGDAGAVLDALHRELDACAPDPRPRAPEEAGALRRARTAETRERDARWVPYLDALRSVLDEDAVLTSDSAQCCYYGALPHLPLGPSGRYLHPTGFGTLGYALPAAVGAKAAAPDRQVVALSGDGGLQFSVQELATAAALRLPLPVVVFDNGGYGEIRDGMAARGDSPTAVDLPAVDLPALARAYGGAGAHARTPDELSAALRTALTFPGPTLVVVPETAPATHPQSTEEPTP
ncbi:5-guanidino-2-oxopentanoate decarboxylase [Streptomyces sp. HNM0574]|uniref:5-guanidino-2-oxopentanoate decarboxylase n=1 Tax=Streptomyces sp. HNM0574 TaxID=2714954 RepID=UPI00146AD4E4|nr:5-guanidino-2-oxopentanoate decarboxylase [Streptomyces sp. HNM0574]NLU70650.1 5-guanidino-2-oxopentanoate decarboxylase [Streptomyces sp. HNM0574]